MGKITDTFIKLEYINEAQVSQNFVIPFLVAFLGYDITEIIPENDYPNRIIPYGKRGIKTKDIPRSQRPDYVICQDTLDNPLFVLDSKGPSEKLDEHLPQLLSYSLGAGVNFLVITNGKEMLVYYGQEEILKISSISDLDIYFEFIKSLLHKDVFKKFTPLEIINSADFNIIKELTKDSIEDRKRKNRLTISDYYPYLNNLHKELTNWNSPLYFSSDFSYDVVKVSPKNLHNFKRSDSVPGESEELLSLEEINTSLHNFKRSDSVPSVSDELLPSEEINTNIISQVIILYGLQGIGKSTLLNYMAYNQAEKCINL